MLDQAGPHLDEITADAQTWAAKHPENPRAQLLLAKVLLTRDSSDKAAETLLRRSIALDGSNWEAHYQLGLLLEAAHQYPAAAEELRRATELDKNQPDPHYHLARVYDRMGNPEAAASERAVHKQLLETGKVH
jgi:predicted Zn-dependent protease